MKRKNKRDNNGTKINEQVKRLHTGLLELAFRK